MVSSARRAALTFVGLAVVFDRFEELHLVSEAAHRVGCWFLQGSAGQFRGVVKRSQWSMLLTVRTGVDSLEVNMDCDLGSELIVLLMMLFMRFLSVMGALAG